MIRGMATPIMVSLRNTTNVATSMRLMTRRLRLLWSGAVSVAAMSGEVVSHEVSSRSSVVQGVECHRLGHAK